MPKEADLKNIELKVFIHCCDGCKKKVKKVLRNIEGVFKTNIDPLEPKITILGNVKPQILIKKLVKAGKHAEIWSSKNDQNPQMEEEKIDSPTAENMVKENPKSGGGAQQTKQAETQATGTEKLKDSAINMKEEGSKKAPNNKDTDNMTYATSASLEKTTTKIVNSISQQPELANNIIHPSSAHDTSKEGMTESTKLLQHFYMVENRPVILPYYAMYPYKIPHFAATSSCSQELCGNGRMVCQPPFQAPVTRAGDYFSDENTVGCHVM